MGKSRKGFTLLLASLLLAGLLSGCGGKSQGDEAGSNNNNNGSGNQPTKATLVLYGEQSKRMADFAKNEFHDKVLQAINVDVSIQYLPWTEYATGKTELMLSSGEKFATYTDTAFMAKSVAKGYYADLTEAAEKYAGDLKKNTGGDEAFDIWKVNGKQYALPFGNKPNAGENYVIIAREDLLQEVGMTDLKTVEDVEQFYKLAKQKYPDMIGSGRGWSLNIFNGSINSNINIYQPYSFIMTDGNKPEDPTVYSFYESDEYKQMADIARRWNKEGLIPSYALSNPAQADSSFFAGKALFGMGASYRVFEYMDAIRKANPNAVFKNYYLGDPAKKPLMSRGTYSTAFAVGANVKGAELEGYVKLINLLQSSQEWTDFILYGVEGKDYNLTADGQIEFINQDTLFDTWLPDNIHFTRFRDYITEEQISTYQNWNEGSILQKDIGFSFNMEPVKTEYAQMQAVEQEYIQPISQGFKDYDSNIDTALKKLRDAGLEKFIAEYQKQFSEFISSKKATN
jgi:putative aldouronate transport system substrate-binding protein